MMRALALLATVIALGACGTRVKPLSPRDLTLPQETRRWIADAEDGVIIARAHRDAEAASLEAMNTWSSEILDRARFRGGSSPKNALERLMDGRVRLEELELDEADAALDLSEAKFVLANAERSVLHDRARYDLGPLRTQAETARNKLRDTRLAVRRQRQRVEALTTDWWTAYARYVAAGGDTTSYWTAGR